MAARMTPPVRWLVGLMASLLFPLIAAALGWDDPWLVVVASAMFGALCLWNLNVAYRDWINDVRAGWQVPAWLKSNLSLAGVGVVSVLGGAALMRWSSAENVQIGIAYALGLWLAGMIPVVQVVRAKLADVADGADAFPSAAAWLLNGLFIALTTVAPAAVITGGEGSGLLIGAVAAAIWLAFEAAGRIIGLRPWMVGFGGAFMAFPVLFLLLAPADWVSLKILFLFPLGLALVSARQRGDAPLRAGSLMKRKENPWVLTGAVGLVLVLVGAVWWWAVIGADVSTLVVLLGIGGAVSFGASLVTRGEGLLVVVLLGLLMIWVVQDHTGGEAPLADPDSPSVLAAFGDSYLSGEGIGTFYAGTNRAGAADLSITGVNECRRSEFAYSPRVATAQGLELAFYGCSGALATSSDFDVDDLARSEKHEFAVNSVYGQLLRWETERGADNDPELVLLSLGGNDAGFATIGGACFLPGSCDAALDAGATPALEGVTTRVETALAKAREMFPTSPMVVVAYPQMFGPDADECGDQVPFDSTETVALRNFVDALNRAVGAAVDSAALDSAGGGQVVHFTGATSAYDGKRFCELDENGSLVEPEAIHALAFQPTEGEDLFDRLNPVKIVHNTFHPTRKGHELIAERLIAFLDADCHLGGDDPLCGADTAPVAAPAPSLVDPQGLVTPAVEDDGSAREELVADAPVGGCDDLNTFNRCTIIQSLRLVVLPIALLVIGGVLLALAVKRGRLVHWLVLKLPLGRFALRITPLRDDVP